ncbi:MAG: response regulator [Betaproteobacteria bacterium]|nr:response regulator [Betaproteobacteria bacterium]MDH4326091.1 response regulator [Betaproteobacteria bacterium]
MPERPLQKICYVEDDDDIQRIARLALERVGKMQVSIIGDPTAAIDGILAFKPDLVLLDWMMPVMDGPTLFKRMRETAGLEDIPVVFITAKASQRELEELRAMGASGVLSKPFSPKDLPEQLRAIWRGLP